LNLVVFIKILSIVEMELLQILVGNCTVLDKPYVDSREIKSCFWVESIKKFILKSPQIMSSIKLPLTQLRRASKLYRKYSKFPDGDRYMFTVLMVWHDRYSLITQASKSFSLQNSYTLVFENWRDSWIYMHTQPFLYLFLQYSAPSC